MKVKFIDFDRSKFSQESMQEGKDNIMGAELEITSGYEKEKSLQSRRFLMEKQKIFLLN